MVICNAPLIIEINLRTTFLTNTSCRLRIMFWTKFKVYSKQRAITSKSGTANLLFFFRLRNDIHTYNFSC